MTTVVAALPEFAIDRMMDLADREGLHPFHGTARMVGSGTGLGGPWFEWDVVERPKFGPVPYTVRFRSRLLRSSPTSMVATVRAAPGCTLVSTMHAEPIDGRTRLTESTVVTAPLPLVGYMSAQARRAHARTFEMLPTKLSR